MRSRQKPCPHDPYHYRCRRRTDHAFSIHAWRRRYVVGIFSWESPINRTFQDISMATGMEIYGPHTFVVNVNGTILGLTRTPFRFVTNFRRLRRSGRFSEFVSIYVNHHHRAVHIASDGGRICRPLIIVENGYAKVTSEHIKVGSFFLACSALSIMFLFFCRN